MMQGDGHHTGFMPPYREGHDTGADEDGVRMFLGLIKLAKASLSMRGNVISAKLPNGKPFPDYTFHCLHCRDLVKKVVGEMFNVLN